MTKIFILMIILGLSVLSSGCDGDGASRNAPVSQPSPVSNPTNPIGPVTPPVAPQSTVTFSCQGFILPSCSPELSQTFYLLIDRQNGTVRAVADVDGESFLIQNWTLTVTLLKDGSSVNVHPTDNLPAANDISPICFKGSLVGKCTQTSGDITLNCVPHANNTIVTGQLNLSNQDPDVHAYLGLCLDNGYVPAWNKPCN